ncbi:GNAT family N-acetyltransferase [Kitasatospora cinereorecta]|uniref:GNAT family N-acetyltransferase n=1 Tax=Kitasatospora cinereorecta TaxID=285560 RepID=A0ABW0VLT9_9ACTN
MEKLGRLELANDNAASFWLAQAAAHGWDTLRRPGWTAIRCARDAGDAHRVVITRPYGEPAALEAELADLFVVWGTVGVCVEDPYRRLDLTRHGVTSQLPLAVMTREPGPLPHAAPGGYRRDPDGRVAEPVAVKIEEALDATALAEVERAVVDGFPIPARQPWRPAELLPPALLEQSGFRAWLARVDGHPAGACITYDDGRAVGVYWVATLPDHRSSGIGRAVLTHALGGYPDRVATLTATLLGEPLYRKLGFTEAATTHWWR